MSRTKSKQPKYGALVDVLTTQIEQDMQPGDLLPSERELSQIHGLSRTTVRAALVELERKGLVERQQGLGTFVSAPYRNAANLFDSYSFTEQMKAVGREPSTVTLDFTEIEADGNLAENMGCELGAKVFKIRRLRYADGLPVMFERTFLPADKFAGLTRLMFENRSLYDVIETDFHEVIKGAEEEVHANTARSSDARLLEINEGVPVLDLKRHTFNMDDELIEYTLSVARGDQFNYKIYYHIHEAN